MCAVLYIEFPAEFLPITCLLICFFDLINRSISLLLLKKCCNQSIFLHWIVALRSYTVQPEYNAHARSAGRSSCTIRTLKLLQEVKFSYFCGLPIRTFKVQNLTARSHMNYKKGQEVSLQVKSSRSVCYAMLAVECSVLACNIIH